ncbi:PREDICTED: uncharacterized protein LOC109232496 [Nicotiana attenuata]|uniref:uncharacterized protein LOC109232496 n=1 Tax=Nicotiana attenuata TaxID=49451 RepID=UPI00090563AE|nr:PREDICTED: uncharacterized protein LOC109232496 [Nicotiana attenuata]
MNGKIWAFVDEDIDVDIVMNMEKQMTLMFFHRNLNKEICVTLVYVKCDAIERIQLWDSMYHLASSMESPWLVGGDFNVILSEEEKYGGRPVYLSEVEDLAHCVDTYALYDLGFKGSLYTWWNERSDVDCIYKRLDMFFTNQEFLDLFPSLEVEHLIKYESDHAPLLLSCNIDTMQVKKPFKFLNFWAKCETFLNVIKENWVTDTMGNTFNMFQSKLKKVKSALAAWSKETFGDIFKQIIALEDIIKVHETEFELNPIV